MVFRPWAYLTTFYQRNLTRPKTYCEKFRGGEFPAGTMPRIIIGCKPSSLVVDTSRQRSAAVDVVALECIPKTAVNKLNSLS